MPKKPRKSTITETEITLTKEVKDLSKEVKKLKNLEFVRILKHPWKFLWMSFLHGLMTGFGWVLGASVLVAVFIYLLAKIQLVPFFGGFVTDVIEEVKNIQPVIEERIESKVEDIDVDVENLEELVEEPEATK